MLKYLLPLLLVVPLQTFAIMSGQNATVIIGHKDFDIIGTIHDNVTSNTLYSPDGIAFDKSGNLFVVDTGFNRILEYVPPFKDRMNATLVLGQYDFTSNSDGTT